jgi:hypothetical protein
MRGVTRTSVRTRHGARPRLSVGWQLLLAAGMLPLLLSGCFDNLAFTQDHRIDIRHPEDRSEVKLPFRISWTAKHVTIGPGADSFAVLVDQQPPPPGQNLRWLYRFDLVCRSNPKCPDEAFLEGRAVYNTMKKTVVVRAVPQPAISRGVKKKPEFHELTIVLLDKHGRRLGESAWWLEFKLPASQA